MINVLFGFVERSNDLGLPVPRNIAVARKRRQEAFVAKVLAPRLVLLRRPALLPSEPRQGLTKAVRVEVGKNGSREALKSRNLV